MGTLLGVSVAVLVAAGGGVVAGVLFNSVIRAFLKKIPFVGQYF